MAICKGCGKEFKPPKSYWKYCYDCWNKEEGLPQLSPKKQEREE